MLKTFSLYREKAEMTNDVIKGSRINVVTFVLATTGGMSKLFIKQKLRLKSDSI